MSDPVAFLTARLKEVEAAAARAQSLRDKLDDPHRQVSPDVRDGAEHAWRETSADPARMLREVESKRAIVQLYCLDFSDDGQPVCLGGYGEAYWDVIRDLAAVYSDHPDYDEAWKP